MFSAMRAYRVAVFFLHDAHRWAKTRPYRAFDVPAAQCTTCPDKRRYTRNSPKLTFDIKILQKVLVIK